MDQKVVKKCPWCKSEVKIIQECSMSGKTTSYYKIECTNPDCFIEYITTKAFNLEDHSKDIVSSWNNYENCKKLYTIKDWNKFRQDCLMKKEILNGIECPMCFNELVDYIPEIEFNSHPTKKAVKCTHCKFESTVLK